MNKSLLLIIATLTFASICVVLTSADSAEADDSEYYGNCGEDATFEYDPDTKTLTICGSGEMWNYDDTSELSPWNGYKDQIEKIQIDKNITYVGEYAFFGTAAKEVHFDYDSASSDVLSNSGRVIGDYAFLGSSKISSMWCDGIESIGDYAFQNCTELRILCDFQPNEIGYRAFYHCESLPSIDIETVSSIGGSAFDGCIGLESVIIKGSIDKFEDYTFKGCTQLSSLTVPASITKIGDYVFEDCKKLESVELSENLTSIGKYAFSGCSLLGTVKIPNTVATLGDAAFQNCTGLKELTVPVHLDCVVSTEHPAFSGCVNINKITFIGTGEWHAYDDSSVVYTPWQITEFTALSIVISDEVTSIGISVFENCTKMTELTIPSSANSAGSADSPAFDGCTNIAKITFTKGNETWYQYSEDLYKNTPWMLLSASGLTIAISDDVESIGPFAFKDCTALTKVELGKSLSSIGDGAFVGCSSLTSFVTENSAYAFEDGVLFNKDMDTLVLYPMGNAGSSYELPSGIKSVGNYAFYGYTFTINMSADNNLESIGSYAFYGCTGLVTLTLNKVSSIGKYAFYDCTNLENVTISDADDSKIHLENYAFGGCTNLTQLTVPTNLNCVGYNLYPAFYGCEKIHSITFVKGNGNWFKYGTSSAQVWYYGYTPWFLTKAPELTITISDGVTSVSSDVFKECPRITAVKIDPGSTETVCEYAFRGCTSLASLDLGPVKTLENYVFEGCTGLQSLTISGSVVTIGDHAFDGCKMLGTLDLGDNVERIGESAFYGCTALGEVVIKNMVTCIEKNAFKDCTKLGALYLGDNVERIGDSAFYGCTNLSSITVSSNNKTYSVSDNVLFGGKDTLILYPMGKKDTAYEIPDSVTSIASFAFSGCTSLCYVKIPD